MNEELLEELKSSLGKLTAPEQDHIASFLMMERLRRNQLVMPVMHKRIDDADPENWQTWENAKKTLEDS